MQAKQQPPILKKHLSGQIFVDLLIVILGLILLFANLGWVDLTGLLRWIPASLVLWGIGATYYTSISYCDWTGDFYHHCPGLSTGRLGNHRILANLAVLAVVVHSYRRLDVAGEAWNASSRYHRTFCP